MKPKTPIPCTSNHAAEDSASTAPGSSRDPGQKAMTRVAHLVGPGVLRVRNGMPSWEPLDGPPLQLHPERLETLVIHGHADMTAAALKLLWRHGVQLSFLDPKGNRLLGRVSPPPDNAPTLAYCQHWAIRHSAFILAQSRLLVTLRIQSIQRTVQSFKRYDNPELRALPAELDRQLRNAQSADSLPTLRGYEGIASARWHAMMRLLFPPSLPYPGRVHHPPTDPVNALLSLGYTLLLTRVQATISAIGLDPLFGFYHQSRPGRPALTCDLMEPFRTPLVDKLVIAEVRKGCYQTHHFFSGPDGYRLHKDQFRRFVRTFEQRYSETNSGERASFESQVRELVNQFASAVRTWAANHPAPDLGL